MRPTHGSERSGGGSFATEREQRGPKPLRKLCDGVGTARTHEKGLHRFLLRMQRIISDAVTPFKAIWVVWASGSLYWSLKAASFIGAFVSSACSLYAVQNKRGAGGPAGVAPSLVSQEQLVRKAASLCYLLSNEGTISLVSDSSWLLSIFFSSRLFMKT